MIAELQHQFSDKKRVLIALFILMVMALSLGVAAVQIAEAQTTIDATVSTGALNVRVGPGAGFPSVATVSEGQTVTMTGRNADASWARVKTAAGIEGWASTLYLSAPGANYLTLPYVADFEAKAWVATDKLNLRTGPSNGYAVVRVLENGWEMRLIGRNADGSWVQVVLGDSSATGWVGACCIVVNVNILSLPVGRVEANAASANPSASSGSGPAPASSAGGSGSTAVMSQADFLNMRSGPGVDFPVLAVLKKGDSVTMLGRNAASSWIFGRLANGQEGWVSTVYMSFDATAFSLLPISSASVPSGADTGGSPISNPTFVGPQPIDNTAVVIAESLNVRTGPGLGFASIASVQTNNEVTLIGRTADANWTQIRMSTGQEGWVSTVFLSYDADFYRTLPRTGETTASATVTTGTLNVRTGPGTGFDVVTTLNEGAYVTLIARNADQSWVKVRLSDGREGWASTALIESNVPFSILPLAVS